MERQSRVRFPAGRQKRREKGAKRCDELRCVAFGWCQCQLRAFASALLPTRLFNYAAWRRGRSRSSSAQPLGVNGALGIPVLCKVSAFLWRLHLACDVVHVDDVLVRPAPTRPALPDRVDSIPMSAAVSDRPCQRRPERRATGQPWRARRGGGTYIDSRSPYGYLFW